MKHRHADKMKQYADDAARTDKPWLLWEQRAPHSEWGGCVVHPAWYEQHGYRRKPRKPREFWVADTIAYGSLMQAASHFPIEDIIHVCEITDD